MVALVMEMIIKRIFEEIIFWMAWIIIPIIMEIIPAVGGFLILVKKRLTSKSEITPIFLPEISLIIPVYNSSKTLYSCLESVYHSTYPADKISIMLVNNQSKDNSFKIFTESQRKFPELSMQWLNAKQGKSKALNMALFNSSGKYIIHIDSDGKLHPDALINVVRRFEQNPKIHCITGAVLIDPTLVEKTSNFFLRLLRKCEMYEYFQAFLAGRNFESELNSIYTLSGAFSAFRKSTILKTQLYNSDTVCEDTHLTFQVRRLLKKSVNICENALFFVDPIDNFDKLYTQRQRWQRGEIEVSHMFLNSEMSVTKGFFGNFMVRLLVFDHTFAFPRMIWYFALICLAFLNYPLELILGSVIIIYALYVLSSFLYFLNINSYLKSFSTLKKYYRSKWYLIFILPVFNFMVFWIRLAGIINSINTESHWKTSSLKEELKKLNGTVKSDFSVFISFINKIRKRVNND